MTEKVTEAELEVLRGRAKRRYILLFVLCGLLFLLFLAFFNWCLYGRREFPFVMNLIIALFAAVLVTALCFTLFWSLFVKRAYNRYNLIFKNQYVLSTIAGMGIFGDLQYDPASGFTHRQIRNAAVVGCGEERHFLSEDMLTGSYRGTSFWISDVTTRKMVHHQKRVEIETIFDGQVIRFAEFDESKASSGYLQIFQKEFLSDLRGWTADHKIQTESEEFNRRFQIYAEDEHNAYYILTPQQMEQIAAFADSVGEQIAVSFHKQEMFVAIHRSRSLFDAAVDKAVALQREDILGDARLLQQAGDILLCTE